MVTLNITVKIPGKSSIKKRYSAECTVFIQSQQKWVPAEIYSPLQEKCTGMAANHKQSESQKTQLHHQHNASVSQQWIHLLVNQKNGITCQLTI